MAAAICLHCHLGYWLSLKTTYLHNFSSHLHYRMDLVASVTVQPVPWEMLWLTHSGKEVLTGKQRHKACGSCLVDACVTKYCDFRPVALPSRSSSNFWGIWLYFQGARLFGTDQNLLPGSDDVVVVLWYWKQKTSKANGFGNYVGCPFGHQNPPASWVFRFLGLRVGHSFLSKQNCHLKWGDIPRIWEISFSL